LTVSHTKQNDIELKKLIRRWHSERELCLRRHLTRTIKYNRLMHRFRHRSTRLCVYQIQLNNAMERPLRNLRRSRSPILVLVESWLLVKFSLAIGECLTLTLSLGWSPNNIVTNDTSLKTRFFGLHFRCRKHWCIFNHFYVIRLEIYRIRNYAVVRAIRRSRSSKVTEFGGTNRKLICDFLLVINTNLVPILHRFQDSVR